MRIILAKLSAMTLVVAAASASMVSVEKPAMPSLRGPIALAEALSGIANSDQVESPASDVTAKSDDEDKGKSSDVSKSKSLSSDDANDALFPHEMDEEEGYDDDRNNDDDRPQKKNASQKRQDQRDERRSRNNPNRSQDEEQRERERKSRQASERGDRCQDPSEPGCGNDNYPRNREAKRRYRCDTRGESCDYSRSNTNDEPNRRRADRDMDCIDYCNDNNSGRAATDDWRENNRNRGDSRARECTDRHCDGNKWKNGAATLGEWLLTQE